MTICRTTGRCFRAPSRGAVLPRLAAFSLVELVIVVVIAGIVSAVAVPRFSRASKSSTASYVAGSVASVRRAIEHYYAEHGRYPGYNPGSGNPNDTMFVRQLLEYSDQTGNTQEGYGYPFIYGPYLRPPFPVNPFNNLDTVKVKQKPQDGYVIGATGWVAVLSTGDFGLNATAEQTAEIAQGSVKEGMVKAKGP